MTPNNSKQKWTKWIFMVVVAAALAVAPLLAWLGWNLFMFGVYFIGALAIFRFVGPLDRLFQFLAMRLWVKSIETFSVEALELELQESGAELAAMERSKAAMEASVSTLSEKLDERRGRLSPERIQETEEEITLRRAIFEEFSRAYVKAFEAHQEFGLVVERAREDEEMAKETAEGAKLFKINPRQEREKRIALDAIRKRLHTARAELRTALERAQLERQWEERQQQRPLGAGTTLAVLPASSTAGQVIDAEVVREPEPVEVRRRGRG
ncbi:MAG: hypothetical protein HYS57_00120 [Parcubacteria group bacterium]|nr:hypothetical protein [Parcubacteria group bacterium]